MSIRDRVLQLSRKGYVCSQIILILILEMTGSTNFDLINAMHGLGGGVGFSGDCCGCMTGGCCALSLSASKENDSFTKSETYLNCLDTFTKWFADTYGDTDCRKILKGDKNNLLHCPEIITATLEKCLDIMENQGLA